MLLANRLRYAYYFTICFSALRHAYRDCLPRLRHAAAVAFIDAIAATLTITVMSRHAMLMPLRH